MTLTIYVIYIMTASYNFQNKGKLKVMKETSKSL